MLVFFLCVSLTQDDVELQAADAREGPLRRPSRKRRPEAEGVGEPGLHPDHQDARGFAQGVLP